MTLNIKKPQIYLVPIVVLITTYYYVNDAPVYLTATLVIITLISAVISVESIDTNYVYGIVAGLGVIGMIFGYLRYNSIITVGINLFVVILSVGKYVMKNSMRNS
jgi:hypothetical protein